MRTTVLAIVLFGLGTTLQAQIPGDGLPLLEGSAHKYQTIRSYQSSATAQRRLDEGLTERVQLTFAYASTRMTPPSLHVPMLPQAILENPKVFDQQGKVMTSVTPVSGPGPVFSFDQIAWEVVSAKITGAETVNSHPCEIVDVEYEGTRRNPKGEPVRYWIEPITGIVWKMQFSEPDQASPAGDPVRWTVVWDAWTEDQPPPGWLLEFSKSMAGPERPALIGHQAPEVKGRYLNGDQFDLSKLKGDIVVLDFWATWCGPCAEEMASLEQLKDSLSAKKVVFVSVTDDSPEKVKRWMVERKRSLPTATVAPETAFSSYGIDQLPQLVIIDRRGIVADHWAGMRSERDLRQKIEKLLAE